MTNQYALGYKAGLEAAVNVCENNSPDPFEALSAFDRGADMACQDIANQIAALPVPEVQWRDIPEVRELIDALNAMLTHMGMDEDEWNKPTFDQARAVIAKFKEKQL